MPMSAQAVLAPILDVDGSVPDGITPEQYFDLTASGLKAMPERRLMFAILLDAILQLQRKGSAGSIEALQWIRSKKDWPCSFERVCHALELEPSRLASGLLDWYASGRSKLFSVPARQLRVRHVRITPPRGRRNRRPERARLSGRARIASVARA